jgi:hypothetical protein
MTNPLQSEREARARECVSAIYPRVKGKFPAEQALTELVDILNAALASRTPSPAPEGAAEPSIRELTEALLVEVIDDKCDDTHSVQAIARTLRAALAAVPKAAEPPEQEPSGLTGALARLFPMIEQAMKIYVFTADRAGEIAADMNVLREAAIASQKGAA